MTNQDPIAAWRLRYGRIIEHLGDTEMAEARRCGDEAVGLMRATPDGDAAAEIERLRAENSRERPPASRPRPLPQRGGDQP